MFGRQAASKAVEDGGDVEPQVIDTACRRILTTQLDFAARELPLEDYPATLVACPTHVALAREAAEKSAVLLENDGVLPLASGTRLAVLGWLAAIENTGDNGSSRVRAPHVVTALAGLSGVTQVAHADESDLAAVAAACAGADAAVCVVGFTAREEGEFIPGDMTLGQDGAAGAIGGDRRDLELPSAQVAMIEAAAASGKPVVVVIVAGSAVLVEKWRARAHAILQTFYSGMEGGTALARLLFGDISPSGKLPFTVARDAADYPFLDIDATAIAYGYWHGYAKFEAEGRAPRYPFGHGLSYARFTYRALSVRRVGERIAVSVAVRNEGAVTADEVVQAYVAYPGTVARRAAKQLHGFARVTLAPGETRLVTLEIAVADLMYRDVATHGWRLEVGARIGCWSGRRRRGPVLRRW